MRRCSRPTCPEHGVVAVAFDAGSRVAVFEAPTEWSALILCRPCADRLTLPAGWTWLDGAGQMALFPELATVVVPAPALELVEEDPPPLDQLELFEPPAAIEPDPDGWSWPVGLDDGPIDELASVDESTPLLARAFRASQAS